MTADLDINIKYHDVPDKHREEGYLILRWHLSATGWNSDIWATIEPTDLRQNGAQQNIAELGFNPMDRAEAQERAIAWAEGQGWHKAGRWSGWRKPLPNWAPARWVKVKR